MTNSNLSDFFNIAETTSYNYDSYKCQNWYLVDGVKCFVTPLILKDVEPIAQSDDLNAYDIKHFATFARKYNMSEIEANEYHVTDNEENDYTKVIQFGSAIELTQLDYQGFDDMPTIKTVWHKADNEMKLATQEEKNAAQDVLSLIDGYDKSSQKGNVTDIIDLKEDAKMYLFEKGDIESSVIIYADGTSFVLDDWQGSRPETLEEIEDYNWISLYDGRKAVIMDGLPRLF